MSTETFESIHLDLSKVSGRCRFADAGLAWKPSGASETWTLDSDQIQSGQWSRAARGYELKIATRNDGVIQLDGFHLEDADKITKIFKNWYNVPFESKEHSLRGWNWGKTDFGKQELAFNVQSRPAFEIPYTEIMNTNLAGKNEVAVEFKLPDNNDGEKKGSAKFGGKNGSKAAGAIDELVEMRFYIPGAVKTGDGGSGDEEEEQNAANHFYDTLMDKAEIGEVAGTTFATFLEVLHLTPRGRFDIDMYESAFRLRGKTYDYKISFDHIKKFMVLPKPDEIHVCICLGLDPPLRQGQTRYPFLVMQFKKDEEVTLDLNMTDEMLESTYKDKLQSHYEAPVANVVAQVFRGLTGKKIAGAAKQFKSHHQQSGVKCSIKANEGHLYCLEKAFMFIPKPATYVSYEHVQVITLSRVGGALAASRTFDITVKLKNGQGEHQFSNINREEQTSLEEFFKIKGLKIKNEMDDESGALLAKALQNEPDLASSDDEVVGADRGSADEDDESVDDDFQSGSDSDVAEEFDSDHESSGGSDGSDDDAMDVDDGDEEEAPPKKKSKTGRK